MNASLHSQQQQVAKGLAFVFVLVVPAKHGAQYLDREAGSCRAALLRERVDMTRSCVCVTESATSHTKSRGKPKVVTGITVTMKYGSPIRTRASEAATGTQRSCTTTGFGPICNGWNDDDDQQVHAAHQQLVFYI